jgi:hypothetical protein
MGPGAQTENGARAIPRLPARTLHTATSAPAATSRSWATYLCGPDPWFGISGNSADAPCFSWPPKRLLGGQRYPARKPGTSSLLPAQSKRTNSAAFEGCQTLASSRNLFEKPGRQKTLPARAGWEQQKQKMKALLVGTPSENNGHSLNGSSANGGLNGNGSSIKKGAVVRLLCDGKEWESGTVEQVLLARCKGQLFREYEIKLTTSGCRTWVQAEKLTPVTTRPALTFKLRRPQGTGKRI